MMLTHAELLGTHDSYDGEGLTLQDLLDLLKRIPTKARQNYISVVQDSGTMGDVTGIHFAQSDQAEKWDFKVHLCVNWNK